MFMERNPSDRLLRATASLAIYSQKDPPRGGLAKNVNTGSWDV